MTARRTSAGLIVLLLVSGCGVGDYEAHMRKTQERVQRFEDETRLLGEPLVLPSVEDPKTKTTGPVANIFLRPPRGISDKVGQSRPGGLPYRYAATQTGGAFTAVELAFGGGSPDLTSKYPTWFEGKKDLPKLENRDVGPLKFHYAEFDWNSTESAIVYITPAQKGRTQVALVYWVSAAKKASAPATLNLSLPSLGVDGEAGTRRTNYARRSPWVTAPPR